MRFDLARRSVLAALLVAGTTLAAGCAVPNDSEEEETAASTDAIVDMTHSRVKRQSIGNCWLYATASWAESLNKSTSASGAEINMSESYWTYWHWFDQIANGGAGEEVSTGGHWSTGAEIINRYGVMAEGSFIASEVNDEMSLRQKSALEAINVSLKSGALKTAAARSDRGLVRRELDLAWGLSSSVVYQLNRVFGPTVARTLDRSTVSTSFTSIRRASTIPASLRDPVTKAAYRGTLQDAIGTRGTGWNSRVGRYAWISNGYPYSATSRRQLQIRVQRAVHDKQPVIMSWYVDFNALDDQGRFYAPPVEPGRQGGHLVVLEDYQINNVPGYGTLKVAVNATPAQLTAALNPSAKIEFFRVKNSWGSYRPDRQFVVPGYHDLYMAYLDASWPHCTPNEDDTDSTDDCYDDTPLNDFVLPPGY
jgi:hypothetical protein